MAAAAPVARRIARHSRFFRMSLGNERDRRLVTFHSGLFFRSHALSMKPLQGGGKLLIVSGCQMMPVAVDEHIADDRVAAIGKADVVTRRVLSSDLRQQEDRDDGDRDQDGGGRGQAAFGPPRIEMRD